MTARGMRVIPPYGFADHPKPDVLFVPGGSEIKKPGCVFQGSQNASKHNPHAVDSLFVVWLDDFSVLFPSHARQTPIRESANNPQEAVGTLQNVPVDSQRVDYFNAHIRPILATKCQPCHFEGGKVYAQLPFDNCKTIRHLGTRLFSRIKDENEQALIRAFLAQAADSTKNDSGQPDK